MSDFEKPSGTASQALFDFAALTLIATTMIVAGIETQNNPFPIAADGIIALGGLLGIIGAKRWQDYHELRDNGIQQ